MNTAVVWWLIIKIGYSQSLIPVPYPSLDECKTAAVAAGTSWVCVQSPKPDPLSGISRSY